MLTRDTLRAIREAASESHPDFDGPLTLYGEHSRLSAESLAKERIQFKQIPYEIKARR